MKLATSTTAPDFAALRELNFSHSADYQLIELAAKKRAYAHLYEQYKKLMEMDEHGIAISITMTSPAGTMVVDGNDLFQPMDYIQHLGLKLNARAAEILDLSAAERQGHILGTTETERQEAAMRLQAHALCMPQAPEQHEAAPLAPRASRAA